MDIDSVRPGIKTNRLDGIVARWFGGAEVNLSRFNRYRAHMREQLTSHSADIQASQ